ncbi:MAG: CPBP family intramembrane metalloprotease [Sphingobacteriales bacterium]|nr:MAG: CPBP family intramembrane metalloprotease [Sphingobacteriales bacterium]
MKTILGYLRDFIRRPRFPAELLFGLVVSGIALWLNESWGGERTWIDGSATQSLRLLKYLALYGAAFGGGYLFQMALYPKEPALRLPQLWVGIAIAVILFSVRAWFQPFPLIQNRIAPEYQIITWKYIYNGAGPLLLGLPTLLFWAFSGDRRQMPPYGFSMRYASLKPYFGLLALMLIPLLWAARQPDFQAMYPRAAHLNLPYQGPYNTLLTAGYEVLYTLDYVVTEFFFRGFLILHFARRVGEKAILPMCIFYVVIHFDKPIAEAISSFFGGMILGVLALRTRSIYGGIIIHVGIALIMEALGLL